MDWRIRNATQEDVVYIAENLREGDKDELQALHSDLISPLCTLTASRVCSDMCRVGMIDAGAPLVLYGVAPHPAAAGVGLAAARTERPTDSPPASTPPAATVETFRKSRRDAFERVINCLDRDMNGSLDSALLYY